MKLVKDHSKTLFCFFSPKRPSAGVRVTCVLNRRNGFAEGKIGAKVAVAQSHGEQLL